MMAAGTRIRRFHGTKWPPRWTVLTALYSASRLLLLRPEAWSPVIPIVAPPQSSQLDWIQRHDEVRRRGPPHLYSTEDDSDWPDDGTERSRMNDYIVDFLRKNRNNATATATPHTTTSSSMIDARSDDDKRPIASHLIAMPLDGCHELLLELESVQRAILYHCPILVHACIAPAMTRLPLLYVHASSSSSSSMVSRQLHDITQQAVQQFLVHSDHEGDMRLRTSDVQRDDGTPDWTVANSEGTRPVLLAFQSLELDGDDNRVLHTVARSDNQSPLMPAFVQSLQQRISDALGYATSLPHDPHSTTGSFRPRIPFMRLPENWESVVQNQTSNAKDDFLTSDQGGNGISPIFFCQWWDDIFGMARMRQVAIYPRHSGTNGQDETSFYLPSHAIDLPPGGDALQAEEQRHAAYHDQRMRHAETLVMKDARQRRDSLVDDATGNGMRPQIEDLLFAKTTARLEDLYEHSKLDARSLGNDRVNVDNAHEGGSGTNERSTVAADDTGRPEHPSALDDWARQRIQETIDSRAKLLSERDLSRPKEKPAISDNPVFAKFKDGSLVRQSKATAAVTKEAAARQLPPFPSREHCIGFWRVVSSPTGFVVENNDGHDSSRSDNLILRVDGTVAGGPNLDQKTRQKASGGTWTLMIAEDNEAELRIRLVIPPTKERILVMHGTLDRASLSDLPLASSTFGIPQLEQKAAAAAAADLEDLLYCSGRVWIEDAGTGANREEIGRFGVQKLYTPRELSEYTITIPKPVRNQD